MMRGLAHGYLPDSTNNILVVSGQNIQRDQKLFQGMGLNMVTGSRCLMGLIRDKAAETIWLGEKVQGWEGAEEALSRVEYRHPQAAYTGMNKSIQKE